MAIVTHKGSPVLYASFQFHGAKVFRSTGTTDFTQATELELVLRETLRTYRINYIQTHGREPCRKELLSALSRNADRSDFKVSNNGWKLWKLARVKSSANTRGIDFDLSPEDFDLPMFCPVFNTPLDYTTDPGRGISNEADRQLYTPSLDRLNSNQGYTKDNVIVVSVRANVLKRDATPTELLAVAAFYARFK